MNRERRSSLNKTLKRIRDLQYVTDIKDASETIHQAVGQLAECKDEEDTALGNRPESLTMSSMNDDMFDNINDLSDAEDSLNLALEQCKDKAEFDYEAIKPHIAKAVNHIKSAIDR